MKYLHVEIFLGSGLSDRDASDFFFCSIPESIYENKVELPSLLLVGYITHHKQININNALFVDQTNSDLWAIENDQLVPYKHENAFQRINTDKPIFFMAMYNDQIYSIGKIQEMPKEAYEALKDMLVNFSLE